MFVNLCPSAHLLLLSRLGATIPVDHKDEEYPSVVSDDAEPSVHDKELDVMPESAPTALLPQPVENTQVAVAPPNVGPLLTYLDVARCSVEVDPSLAVDSVDSASPSVPDVPKKFRSPILLTCPTTESAASPHSGGASGNDGEWIKVDSRCRCSNRDIPTVTEQMVRGILDKGKTISTSSSGDLRHSDWYLSPSIRSSCEVINQVCKAALI